MQTLKILVFGMGILIMVGAAVVVSTIVHRMSAPRAGGVAQILLVEPAGTHILSASATAGQLCAVLSGGGADRVVIYDLATGHKTLTASLAQAPAP